MEHTEHHLWSANNSRAATPLSAVPGATPKTGENEATQLRRANARLQRKLQANEAIEKEMRNQITTLEGQISRPNSRPAQFNDVDLVVRDNDTRRGSASSRGGRDRASDWNNHGGRREGRDGKEGEDEEFRWLNSSRRDEEGRGPTPRGRGSRRGSRRGTPNYNADTYNADTYDTNDEGRSMPGKGRGGSNGARRGARRSKPPQRYD